MMSAILKKYEIRVRRPKMMGRVLFSRAAGKIPLRTESESRSERNEGASHTRM